MIQQITKRGVNRNDPCPCGSGRKFKKCCLQAAALGAAKVEASISRLARIFEIGEGILVKGVAFKVEKIIGNFLVIKDLKMSDEEIGQLSCNKERVKETENEQEN
ncbi:MAG: SEC-C metal-binding domain-containing protein [Dehalococcoidales bacterium]